LPANEWIELSAPSAKSALAGLPAAGAGYHALARIPVTPGGGYTLLAEWSDGKPLLVTVRGHDPREAQQPEPPVGAGAAATINAGGGKAARVAFRVDPRSRGSAAWVVFSAVEPGRRVRLLLKSPGDPDPATPVGGLFPLPVYVTGQGGTARDAGGAGGAGPFAFNQWVAVQAPAARALLPAYSGFGPLYHTAIPITLEKGGRYTLFAEWDDGMAVLLEVRGHDPGTNPPSLPSGAAAAATLNISGGHAWRINFVVDPRSRGTTAWLVFPSRQPGRTLRVMVKSPGDPDALTVAPVMGAYVGSVSRTPLYLAGERRD
jgi:hypothetical protein